jgi:hypothetical protein
MRCQGLTKDGKQCSRQCHGKYCFQHKKSVGRSPRSPKRSSKRSPKKEDGDKQRKFCSCVNQIKAKQSLVNPWAACHASIGGRVSNSCKQYNILIK